MIPRNVTPMAKPIEPEITKVAPDQADAFKEALLEFLKEVNDPAIQIAERSDDIDLRRLGTQLALNAALEFFHKCGFPDHLYLLLNSLSLALDDAIAGRDNPLLRRSSRPPGTASAMDLHRQALGVACVDLMAKNGVSQSAAIRHVARQFNEHGVAASGVEALRKMRSKLAGPGKRSHPAWSIYVRLSARLSGVAAMDLGTARKRVRALIAEYAVSLAEKR